MFNKENLVKTIDRELCALSEAIPAGLSFFGLSSQLAGLERRNIKFHTLVTHRRWALRAGDDEIELDKVLNSLQKNPLLGGHLHWWEVAAP
jgi:hypothetical protein